MDEIVRHYIDYEAKYISDKVVGGRLYGEPVDINDVNMLIVAAYLLGKCEWIQEHFIGGKYV